MGIRSWQLMLIAVQLLIPIKPRLLRHLNWEPSVSKLLLWSVERCKPFPWQYGLSFWGSLKPPLTCTTFKVPLSVFWTWEVVKLAPAGGRLNPALSAHSLTCVLGLCRWDTESTGSCSLLQCLGRGHSVHLTQFTEDTTQTANTVWCWHHVSPSRVENLPTSLISSRFAYCTDFQTSWRAIILILRMGIVPSFSPKKLWWQ